MSPERVLGLKRAAEVSEIFRPVPGSPRLRERGNPFMFTPVDSIRFRYFRDTSINSTIDEERLTLTTLLASRLPRHSSQTMVPLS